MGKLYQVTSTCSCDECLEQENATCENDCGECQGCYEAEQDREEVAFEIDYLTGRR